MQTFVIKRLLLTIPIMLLTSIIVFVLMRILPGDPILVLVGQTQAEVSAEQIEQLRQEYGLDQPIYVQYFTWASRAVTGDFGRSIQSRQPVADILRPRLLPTLQIGFLAWILALSIAIPAAIIAAVYPNTWKDWMGSLCALFGAAMPYFLLGGVLIYAVALRLRWLPASGYVSPFVDPLESLRLSILPAVTLGIGLAAVTMRQARGSLIEVLQKEYITTARAKGLRNGSVIMRHAFKNGMLPVVTLLGIQLGNLLGGAVITETIFSIPGMGRLLVDAIFSRDYPIIQAVVLVTGLAVVLANLLVDILYAYLDPRIRY